MGFRNRSRRWIVGLLLALGIPPLAAQDGQLDPGFGGNGTAFRAVDLDTEARDLARALAVQPDGHFLVAGSASDDDGEVTKAVVMRVRPDGSPDPAFASGGVFVLDFSVLGLGYVQGSATSVDLDAAGRILVAGHLRDGTTDRPLLFRLTPSGTLDPTFFGDGVAAGSLAGEARDVDVDRATGVVWAVGTTTTGWIWTWRWQTGTPAEQQWLVPGADQQTGQRIVVQPDGKPILAGSFVATGSTDYDLLVARLLADGTASDPSFGGGGLATDGFDVAPPDYDDDVVLDLALDAEGRVVVFAETEVGPGTFDSASDLGFLRLTAAGAPDPTFGTGGSARVSFLGSGARDAWYEGGLAVQGDGRIVAGSTPGGSPFSVQAGALRLNENGTLDLPFGGGGTGRILIDLEPNGGGGDERCGFAAIGLEAGRVVGAGSSEWNDPDFDFGFARLTNAYLFVDGFEIGSAFFWSATAP